MAKETSTEPTRVSAPKSSGRKFVLHRVEVEKADKGGYVSRHYFKSAEKKGDVGMGYREPETHVHATVADLHKDLSKAFGEKGASSGQESSEEVPAED
jgi:hypothetical protein